MADIFAERPMAGTRERNLTALKLPFAGVNWKPASVYAMHLVGLFDMRLRVTGLSRASAQHGGVSGLPKSDDERNFRLGKDIIRCTLVFCAYRTDGG
jgi:hypothetical protein